MYGFQPPSLRNGRNFADGGQVKKKKHPSGPVKGPGTGISDSVPAQVPEGTYIMPADSTQALGEERLEQMGGASGDNPQEEALEHDGPGGGVPVNLSNGEFKFSPQQVQAIGAQFLDRLKAATHQPVDQPGAPGQGFHPELFFANGGLVGSGSNPGSILASDENPPEPKSIGDWLSGITPSGRAAAAQANARDGLISPSQPIPSPKTATVFPTRPNQFISPATRYDVNSDANIPAGFNAQSLGGGVSKVTVPGKAPLFTDMEPAEGIRSMNVPGGISTANPGNASSPPTVGFNPESFASFLQSRQAGQGPSVSFIPDLSSQKSANSIADSINPLKGSQNGQMTANQLNNLRGAISDLSHDATARYTADQQSNTQLAMNQAREEGDNQRALLNAITSTANTNSRNQIYQQRVNIDATTQGFKNRAAQRMESLQMAYSNAKTPKERSAIADQIRQLGGQNDETRYSPVTVGGGVDPTTGAAKPQQLAVVDRTTGQVQFPGGSSQPAVQGISRAEYDALPKGARYLAQDGKTYIKG